MKPVQLLGRRRLHAGHFAFMRAVVQGLDPRKSWERYLRGEARADSERSIDGTIRWIRDEFAAAAHRHGRHGLARLVRLDAERFKFKPILLPSLEDFARANDMELFSEAEQLEAFHDAYRDELSAEARHTRRRQGLVKRQLDALRWLESVASEAPLRKDLLTDWLDPRLAGHLAKVGIVTVAELMDRINGIGRGWYASIPALGAGKAARILAWLRDHQSGLEMRLGGHVERPRAEVTDDELNVVVEPATAVRPLEKFVVPSGLDGRQGRYRGDRSGTVEDDKSAIVAWLASGGRSANTTRAYRKEVERLLLWSILVRGKAISSLDRADCNQFKAFLGDPVPRSTWCGPRSRARWSPLWRPFEGPLGGSAQRQADKILNGFFEHLVKSGHLAVNNWGVRSQHSKPTWPPTCASAGLEGGGTVPPPWQSDPLAPMHR